MKTSTILQTIWHGIVFVVRLFFVYAAMVIAFIAASGIVSAMLGPIGVSVPAAEASQALPALLLVALLNSMVLAFLILRSRWHGLRLAGTIALLHFGVETFMSQNETLLFNTSIHMPMDDFARIVLAGLLRALIFAPLAVTALGKWRGDSAENAPVRRVEFSAGGWVKRLAFLAVLYVTIYFLFGYYVAWQWPVLRLFYSGTTDIKPVVNQIWDTVTGTPVIVPYQLLRALMWAGLALPVARMMRGKPWVTWLATGLLFGALLASGVLFPNPYMPANVREGHFYELSSSMLLFGAITAWVCSHGTTRFPRSSIGSTPARMRASDSAHG